MQVATGTGQSLNSVSAPSLRHRVNDRRFLASFIPAIVTILLFAYTSQPAFCAADEQPAFPGVFHLAGVPGLRRQQRVTVVPNPDTLMFQAGKIKYEVPYVRIKRILIIDADRRYEGATYLAAIATYGIGSLFILKKHHVDTVILDYENERGGKMGIVVQMEPAQADQFETLMKSRGAPVEEPESPSEPPANAPQTTEGTTK